MKFLIAIMLTALLNGCATFKKIENHYHCYERSAIFIENNTQSVSGSDAKDSLNGNEIEPSVEIPLSFLFRHLNHGRETVPKPFYEDELVTLYQGDCLAVLKDLPSDIVDAVITDPPYCSGGTHAADRSRSTKDKYLTSGIDSPFPNFGGDSKDQRAFQFWCLMWLSECYRLTRDGGVLAQFTDWRQLPVTTDIVQGADWTWKGVAVWNKKNSRPRKGGFRNQCEYVVWGSKGALPVEGPCLSGCFDNAIVMGKKRLHQTQKPVEVMQAICEVAWREESVILDPFAGSGSTLAAAKRLGKRAIGIERSPHYAEVAAERLSNIRMEGERPLAAN